MSYQVIWTLSDQLWRDKCAGKKPDCICALRKKTEDHVKDAVREERSQALRRHLLRQSRQEGVGTRPRAGSGGRRKLQEPFQGERQGIYLTASPPSNSSVHQRTRGNIKPPNLYRRRKGPCLCIGDKMWIIKKKGKNPDKWDKKYKIRVEINGKANNYSDFTLVFYLLSINKLQERYTENLKESSLKILCIKIWMLHEHLCLQKMLVREIKSGFFVLLGDQQLSSRF